MISDNYANINTQAYSSFWVNDLNNDGNLELYVGQDLGGIYRLENDPNSTSSLQETMNEIDVVLYPNPTSNLLTINALENRIAFVQVTNIEGKIVYSEFMGTNKATVDSSIYSAGIYFVKVQLQNGDSVVKKIVKN